MLRKNDIQKRFRDNIRNIWEQITEEEAEKLSSNLHQLAYLIEERYGESRVEIEAKLLKLLASFDNKTDLGSLPAVSSFQRSPLTSMDSHKNL